MALYEHIYLARQDVTAQQVEALTEQLKTIIAAQGGSVSKVEPWGLKSLAYRIKKNRKAHFTLLNIDAPLGGDRRARAPAQHQRRRDPLPDAARRGARGRPVGDAAQARRLATATIAARAARVATAAIAATVRSRRSLAAAPPP